MMKKKEILENLKVLIEENKFISVDELFISVTNDCISKITSENILNKKEHPNPNNISNVVQEYEKDLEIMIEMLTVFCRYRNGKHFEIISETVDKFILMKKNNVDGFGYIWRHLSNYPLLLNTYCLGISFLKYNNIQDLYTLLINKQITQRYSNNSGFDEKFNSTLIEGINAYHVFNNIDNLTVNVYQYLPIVGDIISNQTEVQKRLNANNRIFKYLFNNMKYYFLNDQDFSDYFDLYEFFTGLVFIDKRLSENSLIFAPYGRNFRIYSGAGRYFIANDTLVHRFIEETIKKNNDVLKTGFFGSKAERFENALKEYQSLLSRLG